MKKASNLPFWSKKWSKSEAKISQLAEVALLMMERETGFEPATSTLARSHSTTELFPRSEFCYLPDLRAGVNVFVSQH
jgi:hypothetical protein